MYIFWYHHGETFNEPSLYMNDDDDDIDEGDEMYGILRDLYHDFNDIGSFGYDKQEEGPNNEAKMFSKPLRDSQDSVYDGFKSKISSLVELLHIKTRG